MSRKNRYSISEDDIEVEAKQTVLPSQRKPVKVSVTDEAKKRNPCCSCGCRLLLLHLIATILLNQNKSQASSNVDGVPSSTSTPPHTNTTAQLSMRLQFNSSKGGAIDSSVELMTTQEQDAFEQACQAYFSSHLNDTHTQILHVSVIDQSLSTLSRRRQLPGTAAAKEATRQLKQRSLLLIYMNVSALTIVGSSSSSGSPSSFAKNLAELANSDDSSDLITNLKDRDEYFSNIGQVSAKASSISNAQQVEEDGHGGHGFLDEAKDAGRVNGDDEPPTTDDDEVPSPRSIVASIVPTPFSGTSAPTIISTEPTTTEVSSPSSFVASIVPTPFSGTSAPTILSSEPTVMSNNDGKKERNSGNDESAPLCNGLANLCQTRVDQVLFATLHNAHAATANGFAIFPNHKASLEDAVVAGYRGVNVDIGKCDDQIALTHTFCFLGMRDPIEVFSWIDSFLDDNPNEVLLMPTQIDDEVTLDDIYQVMLQSGDFLDKLYVHDSSSQEFPTLQELIDSNKRILFFTYNGESCEELGSSCPKGFNDWFDFAGETQFSFDSIESVEDTSYSCEITRGGPTSAFFGVNAFLNFPSETAASFLNSAEFLETHLLDCAKANSITNVNVIMVDFWETGDVLDVVQNYNSKLGFSSS